MRRAIALSAAPALRRRRAHTMTVLITVASEHGATREIAARRPPRHRRSRTRTMLGARGLRHLDIPSTLRVRRIDMSR